MAQDTTAVTYHIRFEKDHASVKVTYDLNVPIGAQRSLLAFKSRSKAPI